MDNNEYHTITRSLGAIMAKQDALNDHLQLMLDQHATHLLRLDTTIERLTIAVEDIKTLLARNSPLSENG